MPRDAVAGSSDPFAVVRVGSRPKVYPDLISKVAFQCSIRAQTVLSLHQILGKAAADTAVGPPPDAQAQGDSMVT